MLYRKGIATRSSVALLLGLCGLFGSSSVLSTCDAKTNQAPKATVHRLQPGPDLQYRLQEKLILAVPGDVIEFSAGTFQLKRQIDVSVDNLTLRGQGSDQTILSFKGQASGGQGIEATGDNFTIESLAIEDTAGNAIKVLGARNVTFRDVRTEWTGEPKASNGAYGIYPVQCSNILIDSCVAIGASDSGIYVGQSRGVIVRHCRAERNVAGIEIENTIGADVYENVATDNAGGLLVFDLPGLQVRAGRNVRLFKNELVGNNHKNFAAPGNVVASVPSGTGVMIMATDHVEVFENDIRDNQTANVLLVSYLATEKKFDPKSYDPISEGISIHHNRISGGGTKPSDKLGRMLGALGTPLPDIMYDGIVNPEKDLSGSLGHAIHDNGNATFVNFKLAEMLLASVFKGAYKPSRDLAVFANPIPAIPSVTLAPHDPPKASHAKQTKIYRSAPKKLSQWGLFQGEPRLQRPADGVETYTLNTPLFTDHATKYRFIKLPDGSQSRYRDRGMLEFPEGTVLAKTFSYPHDLRDPESGERLIETRVEFLENGEWYGYSYQWNEDQTEANLILGGGELEVAWIHHDGREMKNRYEIPNANQCISCHSENGRYVPLGPTAMNLNRDYAYEDGVKNQLEHLSEGALLTGLVDEEQRDRLPKADDPSTGSLDERAHAWLEVNCAHCHRPTGTARTSGLDLRFSQRNPSKFGVFKSPVAAGHGSGGHDYDIVPGKPDESILLFRMKSSDPSIRMPNVGRSMTSDEAVQLIHDWIASLPSEEN